MLVDLEISPGVQSGSASLQLPVRYPRGALERLPRWLICIPLTLQWLWLSARYRSVTLPSSANPAITSGGLVGEGKLEYFSGMGPLALEATAPYCVVSTHHPPSAVELRRLMRDAGLFFPVMAKPDLGLCGYGVRKLLSSNELQAYLASFPANETVVLQQFLAQDGEAGIFYVREPGEAEGRLIGLALRHFPQVIGDGHHCLAQLIKQDPRAWRLLASPHHECTHDGGRIPPKGEIVRLASIGSIRVGSLYLDGGAHITPQLTLAIDSIAQDMPSFHFGRFDVRFDNLKDLSAGKGFTIMEVNGAGSEAIQAWDPGFSLRSGLRIIFAKQKILFAIGHAMRRRGFRPVGLRALAQLHHRQQRLIARYPPSN